MAFRFVASHSLKLHSFEKRLSVESMRAFSVAGAADGSGVIEGALSVTHSPLQPLVPLVGEMGTSRVALELEAQEPTTLVLLSVWGLGTNAEKLVCLFFISFKD